MGFSIRASALSLTAFLLCVPCFRLSSSLLCRPRLLWPPPSRIRTGFSTSVKKLPPFLPRTEKDGSTRSRTGSVEQQQPSQQQLQHQQQRQHLWHRPAAVVALQSEFTLNRRG